MRPVLIVDVGDPGVSVAGRAGLPIDGCLFSNLEGELIMNLKNCGDIWAISIPSRIQQKGARCLWSIPTLWYRCWQNIFALQSFLNLIYERFIVTSTIIQFEQETPSSCILCLTVWSVHFTFDQQEKPMCLPALSRRSLSCSVNFTLFLSLGCLQWEAPIDLASPGGTAGATEGGWRKERKRRQGVRCWCSPLKRVTKL